MSAIKRPHYPQTHPAMAVARNIVSQILEEAGVDVATAQRINDDCDQFTAHMVEGYAPITMTPKQWMDCLAHAWDLGWEACSNYVQDGDTDPKFWNVWHDNPYRVERTER